MEVAATRPSGAAVAPSSARVLCLAAMETREPPRPPSAEHVEPTAVRPTVSVPVTTALPNAAADATPNDAPPTLTVSGSELSSLSENV